MRVENAGAQSLKVEVVELSSDKVSAYADMRIRAGTSEVVQIKFSAGDKEGPFSESVLLKTNDPLNKEVRITVTGEVRRTVWTDVPELAFGDLLPNAAVSRIFRIYSAWEEGFAIASKSLPDGVQCTDEPLPDGELAQAQAKSGRLLKVTCSPEFKGNVTTDLEFDVIREGAPRKR